MPRAPTTPPLTGGQNEQEESAPRLPTGLTSAGGAPESRGLGGVVGQDAVVRTLRSALAAGRPHHAYLFDGPEGVGKATCARALFAALNCQAPPAPGDACGACESCQKLGHGSHPDLITFDMTLQGLADESERLIRRLGYSPHEGKIQMVIFDPADNFSAPTAQVAANRLLKTIEEPIPRTHFVLVTSAAQGLLSTLRSRTQRLRFAPLPDDLLRAELRERHGASAEDAARVARLAQGSMARALAHLSDAEGLQRREQAAQAMQEAAQARRAQRITEVAMEVGQDRDEAQEVLGLLWLRIHEALLLGVREGGMGDEALFKELRTVREAREAIRRFTSPQLALERMMRQLGAGRPRREAGGA